MSVDWTKPIQTAEGLPARLLGTLITTHDSSDTRIVAVKHDDGSECCYSYQEDGHFLERVEHVLDIINVPPRKVMREVDAWAVVDRDGTMLNHYSTREFANESWALKNKGARVVRLTGTVEVEVTE